MTRGKKKREGKMKVVYLRATGKGNLSASGEVIDLFKTQHSRAFC